MKRERGSKNRNMSSRCYSLNNYLGKNGLFEVDWKLLENVNKILKKSSHFTNESLHHLGSNLTITETAQHRKLVRFKIKSLLRNDQKNEF